MIRGKRVLVARDTLAFMPKKSSPELSKLLDSAIANARQQGMNPETLFVKTITVDKGSVIRRMKPMARGRAAGIRRTMSIVNLELGTIAAPVAKTEKAANVASTKKSARKTTSHKSSDSSKT